MKTFYFFLFGSMFLFFTATCGSISEGEDESASAVVNENSMKITGTIQEQGMTSYQYGTHTITAANDEFYALKSDSVNLDDYLNEEVTIVAQKIEGYPLSGGPDYMLVLEVKEN